MDEQSPYYLGFGRLLRRPGVWLVPMAWDLLRWGLALGLTWLGMGWVRWDFSVGIRAMAGVLPLRLVPPPALPSAEQLGASLGAQPPAGAGWNWYLAALAPILMMTLLDPLVKAGYLNQVNAALRGVPAGPAAFWRGLRRFGPNQVLLTVLWIPLAMAQSWVAGQQRGLGMAMAVMLVACFYLAQFIIVTDDAVGLQALLGAPFLLWTHLSQLLLPVVLSLAASGVLSAALGLVRFVHPLAAIPVWGVLGTALCGIMMATLQKDMSTRNEPGMPWACRECRAQNTPATDTCAVCGHRHGAQAAG